MQSVRAPAAATAVHGSSQSTAMRNAVHPSIPGTRRDRPLSTPRSTNTLEAVNPAAVVPTIALTPYAWSNIAVLPP